MIEIDPLQRPWPLADVALSRAAEREAQAALPAHALMQRAGAAVARWAMALRPHARTTWACAGAGNNGGDAIVAAHWLHQRGRRVHVRLWGDAGQLPPDAADALRRATADGVPVATGGPIDASPNDVVLDGLLGLGLSRPPTGVMAEAIAGLRALPCPVLAIDLPSGLAADTGVVLGDAAVRATATLSLLTLKPGLWTAAGRDHAGGIWFDDLGVAAPALPSAWLNGGRDLAHRRAREHVGHKGRYGDVQVIGGAPGMAGAALLAARAALAAGAGRVYLVRLDDSADTLDAARPELMLRPAPGRDGALPLDQGTVLCGCGGGDTVASLLPSVLASCRQLVLDADALNAIAADVSLQQALAARAARGLATVLTPHPLEAARLLGHRHAAPVQADRVAAARELAERSQAVVVLKGSGSVIAAPGGTPSINPTGTAALATAGTGDVLAGWLAGLWSAEGVPVARTDPTATSAYRVATRAVFQHGLASHGAIAPLRAADLVERLHAGDGAGPSSAPFAA